MEFFIKNRQVIDRDPWISSMKLTLRASTIQTYLLVVELSVVGYDMISFYEGWPASEDTIGTQDMHFFVYVSYMVFDYRRKIHVMKCSLQ